MRILIIEDEKLATEKLILHLKKIEPQAQILATIDSIDIAINWLNTHAHPDLIISDIHLIDGLSFVIYTQVKVTCPIIFATAYEKYALKAFEVNSIDYLLKPIQEDKLAQALNKYKLLTDKDTKDRTALYDRFQKLLSQSNKNYKTRFLCKLGNKIKSIPIENIAYFYSADKMTFIIDKNQQRLPVNNTLDEIDQLVNPDMFFRINRKYITHFDSISEIHPYFKGRLKLKLNPNVKDDIVVSTEKSPLFKAWLDR